MKYWSCCQRKTTEFQHFLDQEGCDIGSHKWTADKKGIVDYGDEDVDIDCEYFQELPSAANMTGTRLAPISLWLSMPRSITLARALWISAQSD